ncbi:MAG: hypothetical protein ACXWLH_04180 [Candidatus Saccharimonadales bacterium]
MEIRGIVEDKICYEKDFRRFQEDLADRPEEVSLQEAKMLETIRKIADYALPNDEDLFLSEGLRHHSFLDRATPWVCRTESDDHNMTASIRLAHNRSTQPNYWVGKVELKLEDGTSDPDESEKIFTLASFHVYDVTFDKPNPTLIMQLNSDVDFGQPGSESWAQIQELLDEAGTELAAQKLLV